MMTCHVLETGKEETESSIISVLSHTLPKCDALLMLLSHFSGNSRVRGALAVSPSVGISYVIVGYTPDAGW